MGALRIELGHTLMEWYRIYREDWKEGVRSYYPSEELDYLIERTLDGDRGLDDSNFWAIKCLGGMKLFEVNIEDIKER